MYLCNMKRFFPSTSIAIILFMVACGGQSLPEGILGEEVMKEILSDVHLAIALTQKPGRSIEQRDADREEIINSVLSKYQIDRGEFYNSYEFYVRNPILLDSIYSQLIRDMNAWQGKEQLIERDQQLDFQRRRNQKRDSMQNRPPTFMKK